MRRARKVGSLLSSTCHTDDIMRNSGIRLTVNVKNVIHDTVKESSQAAERCRRRSDLFLTQLKFAAVHVRPPGLRHVWAFQLGDFLSLSDVHHS